MNELITEAQALATVTEDQFEAALATLVANMQAFQPTSEPATTAPVATSVTITFSDSSTQTLPTA